MPTLTITKNYADNTTLTETQLDQALESVETFVNTTKLDADNLQSGAVTEAKLATGAATTDKIGTSAVTTAKLADGNVTQVKLAARTTGTTVGAGGVAISGASGSFSTTSTSAVDITNLSVAITTTGRPVILMLQSDGSTTGISSGSLAVTNTTSSATGYIRFVRDSTTIAEGPLNGGFTGATAASLRIPCSAAQYVDTPAAGTYTYKAQGYISGGNLFVLNSKLVVFEL